MESYDLGHVTSYKCTKFNTDFYSLQSANYIYLDGRVGEVDRLSTNWAVCVLLC